MNSPSPVSVSTLPPLLALSQRLGRWLVPLGLLVTTTWLPGAAASAQTKTATATSNPQAMQLRANITEANAKNGIVVARGNVQIDYPARQIKATAAQAVYYSKEGRIVLSGNVYILQQGNSLRGEVVTYLVNEGRFEAVPQAGKQVEAIYLVPTDAAAPPTPVAPQAAPAPTPPKMPFPIPKAKEQPQS